MFTGCEGGADYTHCGHGAEMGWEVAHGKGLWW